jgi:hypothetical protein
MGIGAGWGLGVPSVGHVMCVRTWLIRLITSMGYVQAYRWAMIRNGG